MNDRFWQSLDELVSTTEIHIDRPRGSRHPKLEDIVYSLDYGYLTGTGAIDGGGVDVWVGTEPDRELVGILATVDLFKRDAEIKLLLGCNDEEVALALETSNTGSQAAILIRRATKAG